MIDLKFFSIVVIKAELHNIKHFELEVQIGFIIFVKICPVCRITTSYDRSLIQQGLI